MYINTDVSDYLGEYVADGFPSSSVRTREFTHSPDSYRDSVIQYPELYSKFMLAEKMDMVCGDNPERYHQSLLVADEEHKTIVRLIQPYVPEKQRHYSLLGQLLKIPCDLIVCRRHKDGSHILDLVHLMFPNGWGAEDAIGKDFNYMHDHVRTNATDRRIVPTSPKFVDHLIDSGRTYERVGAFSIRLSPELDRHPHSLEPEVFCNDEPMFVRFERQVIIGAPKYNLMLFFIHTNIVDFRARPELLYQAISKTQPEARLWDKINNNRDYFLQYLEKHCR